MTDIVWLVRAMTEQHFVKPVEKVLLADHSLKVDLKALVPPPPLPKDSVSFRKDEMWWNVVMDVGAKDIEVYESATSFPKAMCEELCLLRCPERCCMNWTMYDSTEFISTKCTSCTKLHPMGVYSAILKRLGDIIGEMTTWPIDFIIYESMNSGSKIPMHLNFIGSLIDTNNILIFNPNPFPITMLLQEKDAAAKHASKHAPKKRGRKTTYKISGHCQVSLIMRVGAVMCLTSNMVKRWDILTVSSVHKNYSVCIAGRYDMANWLTGKYMKDRKMESFRPTARLD